MNELQKINLLKIFCENSVTDIVSGLKQNLILQAAGVERPEELNKIESYSNYYTTICNAAKEVEKISQEASPEGQLRSCLSFLKDANKEGDTNTIPPFKEILEARLFKAWPLPLQEKYKEGVSLALDWMHFFISYTNASKPGINNEYDSLLKNDLGTPFFEAKKEAMNLVAALLYKYFKTERLKCFYDKEILDWGDDFKKEIFDFSTRSFAFVQLVETEIFVKDAPENYCYREYESYHSSINNFSQKNNLVDLIPRCFFVVSNPENVEKYDFKPAELPERYKKWASDISGTEYITLHQKLTKSQLRGKIQGASQKIRDVRNNIFKAFLQSF
jgi:hypothetical protein